MIMSIAFGVNGTWVTDETGTHTFTVVTLLIVATLIIGGTLAFEATDLRIARVAGFARTDTIVIDNSTIRIFTTQTWTAAQTIDT